MIKLGSPQDQLKVEWGRGLGGVCVHIKGE